YMAQYSHEPAVYGVILCSALAVAAGAATIVVLLTLVIFLSVGRWVYSEAVAASVMFMLPGLWCFAVNKVLLNAFNGLQHNRLFAGFTALRYILMSAGVIAAAAAGLRDYQLTAILSISESILMVGLIAAAVHLLAAS